MYNFADNWLQTADLWNRKQPLSTEPQPLSFFLSFFPYSRFSYLLNLLSLFLLRILFSSLSSIFTFSLHPFPSIFNVKQFCLLRPADNLSLKNLYCLRFLLFLHILFLLLYSSRCLFFYFLFLSLNSIQTFLFVSQLPTFRLSSLNLPITMLPLLFSSFLVLQISSPPPNISFIISRNLFVGGSSHFQIKLSS